MGNAIRQLARKLASETRKQADVLNCQARNDFALSKLQPWPENNFTRLEAIRKRDKAKRLVRIASQFEKGNKNGTGLGSTPKPVVIFR